MNPCSNNVWWLRYQLIPHIEMKLITRSTQFFRHLPLRRHALEPEFRIQLPRLMFRRARSPKVRASPGHPDTNSLRASPMNLKEEYAINLEPAFEGLSRRCLQIAFGALRFKRGLGNAHLCSRPPDGRCGRGPIDLQQSRYTPKGTKTRSNQS